MTILDTHVHVWDAERVSYPWLVGASLAPRALPAEIDRGGDDAAGSITRMVFVEADAAATEAIAEARWVSALDWPELVGIVAAADLRSGDLDAHLAALRAAVPPGAPLVGVRHLLQDEPAETWRPGLLAAGLDTLAAHGLTFDACVRHHQLGALASLLERAPEAAVVLDHLGKPPLDEGPDSAAGRAWHAALARIAALPHTAVKLSGLAAETGDAAAYARHSDAFLAAALELFGPARTMLGSDWPVSARMGVGQRASDWIARVRRVTGEADWDAVSATTGAAFYRLAPLP